MFRLRGYYSKAQNSFFLVFLLKSFSLSKKKKDSIFRVLNPREREKEKNSKKKREGKILLFFSLSLWETITNLI